MANKRSIVYHNHLLLGKPEPSLTVPPASKGILEPLEPVLKCANGMQPAEAKDDDEQIACDHPLLMLLLAPVGEPDLTSECSEEVTQADHVLFSRDHDAERPLNLDCR